MEWEVGRETGQEQTLARAALEMVAEEFAHSKDVILRVTKVQSNDVVCGSHPDLDVILSPIEYLREGCSNHSGLPAPSISM